MEHAKFFNVAMRVERSEFLGAETYERTERQRGYRNGFKGKWMQTRVGDMSLENRLFDHSFGLAWMGFPGMQLLPR